jgi:glycosyltransferase involved in cell wall biosynthesis
LPLRVAHLPSSYLPESLGGTEVYVHNLAEEQARAGAEVAVVVHGGGGEGEPPSPLYGVRRLPPLPPCTRAELYTRLQEEPPRGFAEFLDGWRPDVLHFHALTLGAGLGHARLARERGIPYFITYHTPAFSCVRGTLMYEGGAACDGCIEPVRCSGCVLQGLGWPRSLARLLAHSPVRPDHLPEGPWLPRLALPALIQEGYGHWREFMDGAARVVACAGWCRDVLRRNGVEGDKVVVHRQALPGPARARLLRLPPAGRRPLRVGFFGRFCRMKGPDLLLDAVRLLRGQGVEVVCELAGPIAANEAAWARRLLARHRGHAAYLGTRRGPDLRAWLRGLDLVAIPSRCLETGPLTLLEAWDEGVPVVGTDLGGIREFLQAARLDEFLCEPESPASLAGAITRLLASGPGRDITVRVAGTVELGRAMTDLYLGSMSRPVVSTASVTFQR